MVLSRESWNGLGQRDLTDHLLPNPCHTQGMCPGCFKLALDASRSSAATWTTCVSILMLLRDENPSKSITYLKTIRESPKKFLQS